MRGGPVAARYCFLVQIIRGVCSSFLITSSLTPAPQATPSLLNDTMKLANIRCGAAFPPISKLKNADLKQRPSARHQGGRHARVLEERVLPVTRRRWAVSLLLAALSHAGAAGT